MKTENLRFKLAALTVFGAVAFAGCALKRTATEHISNADIALRETQKTEAPQLASLEIHQAQDKIELAKKARDDGDYKESIAFSEEALLNTQLADAKVSCAKAETNAEESRRSTDTLRNETRRNRNARQNQTKE